MPVGARRGERRFQAGLPALGTSASPFLVNPALNRSNQVSRDPDAVRAMFGRIARRYDLANHLLSGGADFLWRRRAAKMVEGWRPKHVLDLATGSGDLALAMQRRLPEATIIAADFSPEMLAVAKRKGVRETVLADALRLPFPDESFDCVTVAFGLRNMADWNLALREMSRVLRSEWTLACSRFFIAVRLVATCLSLLSASMPADFGLARDGSEGGLRLSRRLD